jgi:hypothetical protein
MRRRELDTVNAGQLRDHLELDRPIGEQLERRKRIGKDGAGRDLLKLLDHVPRAKITLLGELILSLTT